MNDTQPLTDTETTPQRQVRLEVFKSLTFLVLTSPSRTTPQGRPALESPFVPVTLPTSVRTPFTMEGLLRSLYVLSSSRETFWRVKTRSETVHVLSRPFTETVTI